MVQIYKIKCCCIILILEKSYLKTFVDYTSEDVGISKEDVQEIMLNEASYFIGKLGQAEDPSPFASLNTFYTIQAAIEFIFNSTSLEGLKVTVKGVGKVSGELVRLLDEAGAKLAVADINKTAVEKN